MNVSRVVLRALMGKAKLRAIGLGVALLLGSRIFLRRCATYNIEVAHIER